MIKLVFDSSSQGLDGNVVPTVVPTEFGTTEIYKE